MPLPAQVGLPSLSSQIGGNVIGQVDKATYTHPKDFSVVINVTEENLRLTEEDNMQSIRACRARDILVGVILPAPSGVPPQKLQVDKSCWTDFEPLENVDKTGVLRNMFPSVAAEDLSDVLYQCGGDLEWAVNILLDSGLEYNEPKASKPPSGASGFSRVSASASTSAYNKDYQEPEPSCSSDQGMISPLAILCQIKLDTSDLLAQEEVQQNLVRGSVKRLQSIEEYRRKSVSENDNATNSPSSEKTSPVHRERLPSLSMINRERVPSLSLAEESYSATAADKSINEMDDMGDEIITDASQMSLTLSPALAKQLISMFGPVGFHISPGKINYRFRYLFRNSYHVIVH